MTTRHYIGASAPHAGIREAFIHASEMHHSVYANPQGHTVLHDSDLPDWGGYPTSDEGAVTRACARAKPGNWIEVNAGTGWTASHIADTEGVTLISLEPKFSQATRQRFDGNIDRRGLTDRVIAVGKSSCDFLRGFGACKFDGAFVGSELEPSLPAEDAAMLLPHMKDDCVIVFHNAVAATVQANVRGLLEAGFQWRLYLTAHLLAVCWRGDFVPPTHVPDPTFDWAAWLKPIRFPRDLLQKQS